MSSVSSPIITANFNMVLSTSDVSKILNTDRKTVYKYIKLGKIKAIKFGNNNSPYKITLDELDTFIKKERGNQEN